VRDGLLLRMRDADFADVLEVNLVAAFRCTREALRGMLRRRWGRIVSISSVVGLVGNPGQANYAASKAGLIGLTMSVAREVASRGVTANVVAPGYVPSKLTDAMSEEAKQATLGQIPAGRLGAVRVGAAVGALLYAIVFMFSAAYLPTTGNECCTQYSIVFTFVLMALVLAFRPQGLFGRAG